MASIGSENTVITTSYTEEFNSKLDKASVSNDTSLTASSPDLVPTQNAVKSYVDSHSSSSVSDATSSAKGVIKLSGDLGGTADSPSVPALVSINSQLSTIGSNISSLNTGKEDVLNKSSSTSLGSSNILYPTQGAVKSYVDTGLGGKVSNTGDQTIGGIKTFTSSPVVPSIVYTDIANKSVNKGYVDSIKSGSAALSNATLISSMLVSNGNGQSAYTVPAGKKAIVSSCTVYNSTGLSATANILVSGSSRIFGSAQNRVAMSLNVSSSSTGSFANTNSPFVFETGESIVINATTGCNIFTSILVFDAASPVRSVIFRYDSTNTPSVSLSTYGNSAGYYTGVVSSPILISQSTVSICGYLMTSNNDVSPTTTFFQIDGITMGTTTSPTGSVVAQTIPYGLPYGRSISAQIGLPSSTSIFSWVTISNA